jgi:phage shock protein A
MFDNLRSAFREAVENFNKELSRDRVPEAVDGLLAGMRAEVVEAQARVRELEAQITRATAEAEREKSEAATARRRGKMAEDIGDADTAKVAAEYAVRREERQRVLEQKAAAMKEELAIRTREVEDMLAKMKEAQASRDGLAASAGRTGARESLYAADDLFSELDRMAEKIGHEDAQAQAAEEFAGLDLDADPDFAPPPPPEVDLDARLEELKRKMGRDQEP